MKSKLFILCYAILCLCVLNNTFPTRHQDILTQDKSGYHLYLPAAFIYHDLRNLSFYEQIQEKYHPTSDIKWSGLKDRPDGSRINKYAIGVSVMELPFFLVAHAYAQSTHRYEADGYSIPYRAASAISNIFWCIIGLVFLRLLLRRYFNDTTVLITLACMALGTNLYYQTALDGGSHVYCFCLVACALYYTDKWYATARASDLYKLALSLGFLIITRPVDILIVLAVLFWKTHNQTTLAARIKTLSHHIPKLLIAFIFFLAVAFIQMSYWKHVTGHWIFYSYDNERFDFLNPHVGKGLFSFRKGWFIYTPMAAVSCLGLFFLWRQYKSLVPAIAGTFLVIVYVVFSWTGWWYGGSFSARPMIDFIPLLSLPLAALISQVISWRPIPGIAAFTLLSAFIVLNLFQSYQFTKNIIHYDRMTAAYYWRVFGKTSVSEEDLQYLMSDREYWKAMSEAYD